MRERERERERETEIALTDPAQHTTHIYTHTPYSLALSTFIGVIYVSLCLWRDLERPGDLLAEPVSNIGLAAAACSSRISRPTDDCRRCSLQCWPIIVQQLW